MKNSYDIQNQYKSESRKKNRILPALLLAGVLSSIIPFSSCSRDIQPVQGESGTAVTSQVNKKESELERKIQSESFHEELNDEDFNYVTGNQNSANTTNRILKDDNFALYANFNGTDTYFNIEGREVAVYSVLNLKGSPILTETYRNTIEKTYDWKSKEEFGNTKNVLDIGLYKTTKDDNFFFVSAQIPDKNIFTLNRNYLELKNSKLVRFKTPQDVAKLDRSENKVISSDLRVLATLVDEQLKKILK